MTIIFEVAKWICPCGNTIRSSGAIPNPQEWHLLSDARVSEMFDDGAAAITPQSVTDGAVFVYRCDRCDRLHVFWDGIDGWPPSIYAPE